MPDRGLETANKQPRRRMNRGHARFGYWRVVGLEVTEAHRLSLLRRTVCALSFAFALGNILAWTDPRLAPISCGSLPKFSTPILGPELLKDPSRDRRKLPTRHFRCRNSSWWLHYESHFSKGPHIFEKNWRFSAVSDLIIK